MVLYLFTLFFLAFSVVYWAVGAWSARAVRDADDYFLAGRNLGFLSLTITLVATQLGAGMILGASSHAYSMGMPGMFYSIGLCGGFVLMGLGFAGALRSFNVSTTSELFEQQYDSVRLRRVASLLSILALTGIFIGQVVASKALMSGLGLQSESLFLLFWGVLVWYTMQGGLVAVVATDIVQVVIILVILAALIGSMFYQGHIVSSDFSTVFTWQTPGGDTQGYWMGYILMPMLSSIIEQDLAQRFFAARTRRIAMISSLAASAILMVVASIPVLIGIRARLLGIAVGPGQNPFVLYVAQNAGPVLYALVLCALVAAIASTADSLLCAVSSHVVQDFIPETSSTQSRMRASRIATAVTGIAGVLGAYFCADILPVLTQSYELLVSSVLISILVCFTSVERRSTAALFSVIAGFGSFFFFRLIVPPFGMPRSLASLVVSLIGYGIGYRTHVRAQKNGGR